MTNAWFVNGIQTTLGAKNVSMTGRDAQDKREMGEEEFKASARRRLNACYALRDG